MDWLTTQFREDDQYQIYMFNNVTEPVIRGTEGVWLTAGDGVQLSEAIRVLRRTAPKNGTNMHSAFAVAKSLSPRPDNIILLVDGMPTMEAATTDRDVVGPSERLNIFSRATRELPSGIPVNVMLFPMEGDFDAPISFWSLALTTGGSFLTVSRDWP